MAADKGPSSAFGQQVLDRLVEIYAGGGPGFALAVLPGQAVDNDLVQNGVVNPLVVSEWLRAEYDYPLLLRLSDCTPIPAAIGSGITASSLYAAIAGYGRPAGADGSESAARVRDLLNLARKDLGPNPEALPLSVEPDDWAAPSGAAHWQSFDTTIAETPSDAPAAGQGTSGVVANPLLWRLRGQVEEGVAAAPRDTMLGLNADRASALRVAMESVTEESPGGDPGTAAALLPPEVATAQEHAALSNSAVRLMPSLRPRMITAVGAEAVVDDVPAPEPPTSATDPGSDLHVHFEHCLVRIVRRIGGRSWWHGELIADAGWYLPGMRRGQLVPSPPEDGTAHCLPQALLLVRDVRITGQWTDGARAALGTSMPAFGPFLLRSDAAASVGGDGTVARTTTVLGLGTQVIGVLGTPLPALPPTDDPGRPPAPEYEPFPGAKWFKGAPRSPVIHAMGKRLVQEGCSAYKEAPGPQWTQADRASFTLWQRKLGYRGTDADGIPGPASWKALRVPR